MPTFLVPYNCEFPQNCMASKVSHYFEKLKLSFGELPESGPVFDGVNQVCSGYIGYIGQPMGQHYLAAIGKDMVQLA